MAQVALVLGAKGAFGGAVARALAVAGWQVRSYERGTDMVAAAQGVDLIVNGLNPPGYHDWARAIPAITEQVLAAAKASGATVLVPGNVYPYGREAAPWGPDTPHRPVARKGAIRAAMEARYRAAATAGEARVIVLRGGDFMAEGVPGLMINRMVLKDVAKGRITALGPRDVPHSWAYLPDMARAAVGLVALGRALPAYADIPFAGFTASVDDIARAAERATGRKMVVKRFPMWVFTALSPFWELARELREMLYLYEHPHWMEADTLAAWLPDCRGTPLDEVIARHCQSLMAQNSI